MAISYVTETGERHDNGDGLLQRRAESVLTRLRALRRRLRCELRTEGLHQFDFRSGRCVYCGSKSPRVVGTSDVREHKWSGTSHRGRVPWLVWVAKNTRALTSRFRNTSRAARR